VPRRDQADCAGAEEGIKDDAGTTRREAVTAAKLADPADLKHALIGPASDDPRRPGPGTVTLDADPLRAGREDRPLDQPLGEGRLMAQAVKGGRHRPHVAGVLALGVADLTGGAELAEPVVVALVQASEAGR